MYATVGSAKLDASRRNEAVAVAKNVFIDVSEAGFVSGVFTRSTDGTPDRRTIMFDSEETARAVAENAQGMSPDGDRQIVSLEVFEVVDRR